MNDLLREDITKAIEKGMSLDNDSDLWHYQTWLEKGIGNRLREEEVLGVKSGFRERIKGKILGRSYAIGVTSGTAALQFSLIALGIGQNDEVITVPNTYIATLLAISNTGAKPALVDIDDKTMLIDTNKIEEKINENTKAIMPVHLYGQMADMGSIKKIAKKHGLHIIEDAAHSPLAKFNGKFPGDLSDAACYSLHPNKSLGAATNGGMVITKSQKVFSNVEILRNPKSNNPLLLRSHRTPGYLDWIQMVFVDSKLKHLREWTDRRRQIAKKYYENLLNSGIVLPAVDKRAYHVFCDFVIRTKKRDKLKKYLRRKGIETAIHYQEPVHFTDTYRYLGHKKGDFPVAEKACERVLCLPINPFLRDDEVHYIIKNIKSFFKKY